MTRLTSEAYRTHLRAESRRFRDVLADADPVAPVPSCPGWSAADLLWHLGDVQWFWTQVLRRRPDGPDDALEASRPVRPASYAGLVAAFDDASSSLLAELDAVDDSEPAWTWSTERTVGFVARRQAHEALVHRVDAERTAGPAVSVVDAGLAADGVAELVDVMYGGDVPDWGRTEPGEQVVRLELTDVGRTLWVRPARFVGTDPTTGTTYDEPMLDRLAADPGTSADAVLRGTAASVDLWMWNRDDDAGIGTSGETTALEALRAVVAEPLT